MFAALQFRCDVRDAREKVARKRRVITWCTYDAAIALSLSERDGKASVFISIQNAQPPLTEDIHVLRTVAALKSRIIEALESAIDSRQKTHIIAEHCEEIKKRVESHFELAASERVNKAMAEEEVDLNRLVRRTQLLSWDSTDAASTPTVDQHIATLRFQGQQFAKLRAEYMKEKERECAAAINSIGMEGFWEEAVRDPSCWLIGPRDLEYHTDGDGYSDVSYDSDDYEIDDRDDPRDSQYEWEGGCGE